MAYLRTCYGCRFVDDCSIRRGMLERIRDTNREYREGVGHGVQITSVLFTCPKRLEGFEPGRRVEIEFRWSEGNDYCAHFYGEEIGGWITGTTRRRPPQITVWLDRETERGKRHIRLWPLLDGPGVFIELKGEWRDPEELAIEIQQAAAKRDGREWIP